MANEMYVVRSTKSSEKHDVEKLILSLVVCPFDMQIAKIVAELETALLRKGISIDLEDIIIAASALAYQESVLTKNVKHFSQITGISVLTY